MLLIYLFIDTHKKEQQNPQVFAEDVIKCDSCGSIRIIKYGFDCGNEPISVKNVSINLESHQY